MSPIEKYRLVQDIYFSLQTSHSPEEILRILKGYGIEYIPSKAYQQDEIKELINATENNTVLLIADDLKLDTSGYTVKPSGRKKSPTKQTFLKKVFISHSHEDEAIVRLFIQMIEKIGISSDDIFCTSLEGYGTPLGHDFMQTIKKEINDEVLVFSMLSDHFYKSPMCLIEMGASWIQTKDHISIAIPPFGLGEIKGVFQHFQGIRVDLENHMDLLKDTLESKFEITPIRHLQWTPTRDTLLKNIHQELDHRRHG
ncbi:toll/interleukin-1 receptor domain-containing protein [uncultured Dokdonia sp.]|uniref:toll/interleukin-1 receptor domain-containing protein n=1 Tax=uncultured Dokdonia sp. TaxID=575653 RepID=UPI00262F063C|nr:toll/interleukin-1 receptor domain-containing protein [uncultured Dokdonia sp.]